MIAFITWILYYTGSPGKLVGMPYILPIIVTGLVLGRGVTMLQVALSGTWGQSGNAAEERRPGALREQSARA